MLTKSHPSSWTPWARIIGVTLVFAFISAFWYSVIPIASRSLRLTDPMAPTGVLMGCMLISEWILFGLLTFWLRHQGRSLRELGWGKPIRLLPLALAVLVILAWSSLVFWIPEVRAQLFVLNWLKLVSLMVALTAGIVEETVFRGFIIRELEVAGVPVAVQILVSGITFGLIHISIFSVGGIFGSALIGMVMAAIYIAGRRSLTPVIIAHCLGDIITEPAWLLFLLGSLLPR